MLATLKTLAWIITFPIWALPALYFLPWLLARARRHPKLEAIFLLDLLAGWTFVGWVIAIVWAANQPAQRA